MGKQTTAPRGWRQWTSGHAGRQLRAWRASGLSLGTFARRRGLSAQRLRWWRDRLSDWEETAAVAPGLAPAVVTGALAAPASASVTVRLPSGAVLELADAAGVPPAWLVAVVGGLSRAG